MSLGERQEGAGSVAAPIMDGDDPVAVISVCGPLERFSPKVDEAAELVVAETKAISRCTAPLAEPTRRAERQVRPAERVPQL